MSRELNNPDLQPPSVMPLEPKHNETVRYHDHAAAQPENDVKPIEPWSLPWDYVKACAYLSTSESGCPAIKKIEP
jgi:hypothetical protein